MFEESRIWILLSLIGAFVAFCLGAHYFNSVDEANLALIESQSKLRDMQEVLAIRKKDWVEKEQAVAKIQVEADKSAKLLKLQETLDARYFKAESELNYLVDSMKTSVEKVRNDAAGTELGELTLADNRVLRSVKIRKVADVGISLIHAEGIGTVPPELLHESMKEKFDLGPAALLPLIQKAQTDFVSKKDGKAPVVQSSAPMPKPADPARLAANIALDAKIKGIRIKIAQLEAKISSYASLVSQYNQAANSHQTLAATAQSRGTPSTRHTMSANESLAQAAAVERQINELRIEQKKLNLDLEGALKNR